MSVMSSIKSNDIPYELFHYTTQDGLLGILNSKSIWATKALCLNDSSEYVLALNLAKEILTELEESRKYDQKNINAIRSGLRIIRMLNIFVSSFTENGDQLSQWRAYGNSSGGYSIGFKAEVLAEQAKLQGFYLTKCIYEPLKQRETMESFLIENLLKINDYLEKHKDIDNISIPDSLKYPISEELGSLAPVLKSEGFIEENEWRLISDGALSSVDVQYRSGQSFLIPYYEIKPQNFLEAISTIIIGPSPHPDISEDSLEMLLFHHHLHKNVQVKRTSIPFRNW